MVSLPKKVNDPQGRNIELNRERWIHIISDAPHGGLANMKEEVLKTVKSPDSVIPQSGRDDTLHYFREEDSLKYNDYICVVVNIEKEFIVTAFPTSQKKA